MIRLIASFLVLGVSAASFAQSYPAKPIRIIVPLAAGGSSDTVGRMMAEKMQQGFGQPVFVENRAGASGDIGIGLLAKSPPDGYNLGVIGLGTVSIGLLTRKLPYDPIKDLAPVSGLVKSTFVIVASLSAPFSSLAEMISYAKANPGVVNFGSIGIGSSHHLSGELLNNMAGIRLVHVPYKGAGDANIAVVGGQIHLSISGASGVVPHIRSGKLRALAITDIKRSAVLPDVPTVSEAVPGYHSTAALSMFATGGTPPEVISRLNAETRRVLALADVRERIAKSGEEPDPTSPEDLARVVRADIDKWANLIKTSNLKLN